MESNLKNILNMELDRLLEDIEKMENDPKEASEAFKAACTKLSIGDKRFNMNQFIGFLQKIAAILFIPLLVGLITALSIIGAKDPTIWTEVYVPNGEKQEITLSDNTTLTLNSGTRLTYPDRFEGKTREIFLDGELSADVTGDKAKPFIIHAGKQTLKVLGTKFTFKTYDDSDYSEAILLEGSIQLELKTDDITRNVLVSPGEHVRFNKNTGTIETRTFQKEDYEMFASGTSLSFWNTPMIEVAKNLERRFSEKIIILDNEVAQIKVLAFFKENMVCEEILSTIEATYTEIRIEKKFGVYYMTSK